MKSTRTRLLAVSAIMLCMVSPIYGYNHEFDLVPPEDRLDDSDSFISQAITESIKRYTDTITKLIIKYDPEDDWLIYYNDSTILDIQDIHDCFTFCDTMTFYINAQTLPPNYNFPQIDNVVYFTVSQDLVNLVE